MRLVQEHAADLLRFAQRFSLCADDAHDAYQRGIEILVRRMRSDPPAEPLSWLRTVVKHEAGAVREQRKELVGRVAVDLDRHEARDLEDPAERAIGFERLRHTAEALQRLKPQELTALVLRAEGLTYEEIGARLSWTYTKTNRCITEGRRALLARLGAIESGAECERWLPLLSLLADGEASSRELAELRPHLRTCAACRATLRRYHDAPRQVALLVPPVVLAGLATDPAATLAHHVETFVHGVLERATLTVARVQGALDALPGAKLAAVAASSAAIAGGGVAISHVTQAPARPRPVRVEAAATRPPDTLGMAAASFPRAHVPVDPSRSARPTTGAAPTSEFALETAPAAPRSTLAAPPIRAHAAATAPPAPAQPQPTTPAEFAGP